MIAFKVDENLPVEVRDLLRTAGFDAHTVLDEGLGGRPDEEIAAACRAESRALVTFDLDFADATKHRPADYRGIVVLRLERQDKAHVLDVMSALLPRFVAPDLDGKLWIVDEVRIRIRG